MIERKLVFYNKISICLYLTVSAQGNVFFCQLRHISSKYIASGFEAGGSNHEQPRDTHKIN